MSVRLVPASTRLRACTLLPAVVFLALASACAPAQVNPSTGPLKSPGPNPRSIGPEPGPAKVVSIEPYAQAQCNGKKLCQSAFAAALTDARAAFQQSPALHYTITIPGGTYDLSDETSTLPHLKGVVDLSNIRPTGTLTLRGAGSAQTTLITANETTQFFGRNIANVTIQGMTLRRKSMTTTQGTVVKAAPGRVTLRIPPGFPLVPQVFNANSGNGSWLRAYDNTNPLDPHIDTDRTNDQIPIAVTQPPTCEGRLCTIYLKPTQVVPSFYTKPHEIVGVKSSTGGGAYFFDDRDSPGGANVGFKDVVWYDEGRGIFHSIRQIFVLNCAIRRRLPVDGQTQALSSPAGGPRIAYNPDLPEMNAGNRVDHFTAESTGDDSLAIFNDMSTNTVFSNTLISNSFARTINLFKSCHVKLENNVGKFCSPQMDFPKQYLGCITDTSHPGPTPCGPNL